MPKAMKVLVIGGGLAGMSAAIEMTKSGHEVELIDLDPEWRAYGAGITVQAPMFRALRQIGLCDEVAAAGYPCRGSRARLADGTIIGEMMADKLEPGLPDGGGVMRPVLHAILSSHVRHIGIQVRLGITYSDIVDGPNGARVTFTDGGEGTYDLIVAADGIFSKTRERFFPDAPKPEFTGQGAFRTVASRPQGLDMIEVYLGDRIKAGVTPVSETQLYMFTLSAERGDDILSFERQVKRLREVLQDFGGLIGEIRDTLGADSQITYRPLQTVFCPRPWHHGRIVLIGDAAHATTPHLASGACAALEDAVLLNQYVTEGSDIEQALLDFTERRFERCKFIIDRSLLLGRMELAGESSEEHSRLYGEAIAFLNEPV